MKETIFLIDDLGRVEAVLEKSLAGLDLEVVSFTDIPSAKRRLLETKPKLILTLVSFQTSPEGGYRFAKEVSEHTVLSDIPLLLIAEELSEEVIRRASESGAKSLIPWPVTVDSLRSRLRPFVGVPEALPAASQPAAAASPERQAIAAPGPSSAAEGRGNEQKIQLAQQLLAKVLHNLKTSALLEVVDLEDVPRVVHEIARAVCGVKAPESKPAAPAAHPRLSDEKDTVLDLDAAFGIKK